MNEIKYINEKYPLSDLTGKTIKWPLKFINIMERVSGKSFFNRHWILNLLPGILYERENLKYYLF